MSSPALAPAPLLQVEEVSRSYRRGSERITALRSVSFQIMPGETLAVVGESGSGKSTLGRLIVGLERPDQGRILFEDRSPAELQRREAKAVRARLQMIFQDPRSALNPALRVGTLVGEPLVIHGHAQMPPWWRGRRRWLQRHVGEWLERVGLDPSVAARFPSELSGGQRQRVAIARVMILQPRLVVADEILSALDVATAAQIANLLLDLQRQFGCACLFISHDLAWVRQVARRVLVMQQGSIVESGAVEQVLTAPAHPLTRALVAASPRAQSLAVW
jgi:peptide/nickel transport system ATP-binding protein